MWFFSSTGIYPKVDEFFLASPFLQVGNPSTLLVSGHLHNYQTSHLCFKPSPKIVLLGPEVPIFFGNIKLQEDKGFSSVK
jgi:hypothetical protein